MDRSLRFALLMLISLALVTSCGGTLKVGVVEEPTPTLDGSTGLEATA